MASRAAVDVGNAGSEAARQLSRLVMLGVVVVLAAAPLLLHHWDRAHDLANAQRDSDRLARTLESQVAQTIGRIDRTLADLAPELGRPLTPEPAKPPARPGVQPAQPGRPAQPAQAAQAAQAALEAQAAQIVPVLRRRGEEIGGVTFALLRADASRMLQIGQLPVVLDEREAFDIFRTHLQAPSLGLRIAKPRRDAATGQWFMLLSRRINGPDGAVVGALVAAVGLESLGRAYESMQLGPHGAMALHGSDGGLIARYPQAPDQVGKTVADAPSISGNPRPATDGIEQAVSAVDGVERIATYRRVADLPLFVVVGVATQDVLRPIDSRLPVYGAIWLAALAAASALMYVQRGSRPAQKPSVPKPQTVGLVARRIGTVLDGLAESVVLFRPSGHIEHVNRAAERLFGRPAAELVGTSIATLVSVPAGARGDAVGWMVASNGTAREVTAVSAAGRTKPVEMRAATFHLEHEQLCSASFIDLSERREAVRQARISDARFQAVFNAGPSPLALLNPDGTVVEANTAFLARTDAARDSIVGVSIVGVAGWSSGEGNEAWLRQAIDAGQRGEPSRGRLSGTGADDSPAQVDCAIDPILDDKNEVAFLLLEAMDVVAAVSGDQPRQSTPAPAAADSVTEVVVAPPSVVERKLPVEAPAEGVAGRPSAVDPMTSVPDRAAAPATAQPVAAAATMSAIVTGAAALLDQDAPGVISSDGTPAPAMTAAPAGVANDVAIATTPVGTDSASPPVSTQTAPVADCAIETMAGEATPATGTGIVAAGTDHDGAAAAAALPVSHDRAAHTHALEATAATPRLPVADPGIAEGEGIARAADAVARRLDQVADGVIAGEQAVEASAQANDVAPVAVGDEPARAGASAADAGVHDAAAVAAPAVAGDAGVNDVAVIDGDANSDSAADTPSDVTSKGVSSDVIAAGDPDTAAVADATADHVVAALAAAVDSRIDDAPAADAADSAAAMDIAADMPPVVENAASGLTVDQPTDGSEAAPVDDAMTAEALAPPAAAVDLGMAEIVAEAALAIGLHEVAAVPVESGDIAEVAAAAGVDGIEPARPARTVEAADSGRQPADDAAPAVKVDVAADVVVDRNVAAAVPVAEADVVIAPETVRTTAAIGADEAGAAPVAAGATEEVGTVDVTTEVSAPAVGLVPTDTADRPSDETTAVVAGDTMATMAAAAASAAVHRADVGEVEPGSGAATATDAADVSVTQAADGAAVDIAAARDVAGQDATTATASGSTEIATADLEDSAVAGGEVIDSAAAAVVEAGPEQATDIRTESLDTAPASTAPAATPDGEAVDGALPAIAATHVVEHLAPDSAGTTVPEAIEHAVADTDAEPSVAASADVVELMATDAAAAAQPWEVLTTACDPDIEHDSDAAMPVSEPGAGLPVDEHGGLAVVVAPDSSMAEPIAATPAGNATTAAETAESISTAAHAVSVEPAAVVAAPLAPTDISTVVAAAAAVDDVGALSPVIPDESSVHIDEAAPERVAATPAVGGMATKRRRPHPTVYVPPRRVLLVEDDLDALYAMARILSRLGHKVEVAEDGPAALDIYDATGPFDLLVSDKVMDGGMSGPEVARTLQSRQPDLPVLFISADDEDDDEHFVGKPVDQATLAGAIADVVMAPGAMAPGAASPAP